MRFSRQGRGPLSWVRRAKTHTDDNEYDPVNATERSALLNSSAHGDSPPAAEEGAGAADASPSGDPTQQLLTALRRFHRHALRGKQAQPGDPWANDCMIQLIKAVEIALAHGWSDVAEALTETGRVLQSCEDAGQVGVAIPFLDDSYEVFCLMASDLILGKVRPVVLAKWRERYMRALDELRDADIPLVRDEEELAAPAPVDAPPVSDAYPFGEPPLPDAMADDEALPVLDDLPPLRFDAVQEAANPAAEPPVSIHEEPWGPGYLGASIVSFSEGEASAPEPGVDAAEVSPFDAVPEISVASHPEEAPPTEIADILDTLCDGLKRFEQGHNIDRQTTLLAMQEGLEFLEERAKREGSEAAVSACGMLSAVFHLLDAPPGPVPDRLFELAYAFCGVYMEALSTGAPDAVRQWLGECDALINEWRGLGVSPSPAAQWETPAPPSPPPSPAPAASAPIASAPAPDSAEALLDVALLDVARTAAARGQAADAKLLAMRAAAEIAKGEASSAEERVRQAEIALRNSGAEIDTGRANVERAEQHVARCEQEIQQHEATLAQHRTRTAEIDRQLDDLSARIADLDARLNELMAQRRDVEQRRESTRGQYDAAAEAVAKAEADLDAAKYSETTAREGLEGSRQRVKSLQHRRGELEVALEHSREFLLEQRSALDDLERMIQRLVGMGKTSAAEEAKDELLF